MSELVNESTSHEEGYVRVNGLNLYYERFGKGNAHRLLCLHGGPGATHDYLLPFADLAEHDVDVILYDQFGCGRSDDPSNESDYSLDYAIEEVEGVRKAFFGNSKVNLFGNSWGGLLSLAYAIKYQRNLVTLTSSSGLSSVPDTVKEMKRLISLLPEKYSRAINEHEANGDFENPDYIKASEYFMREHTLRMDPFPEEVIRMLEMTARRGTYLKMNGPSEFTITGLIRDIDFTDELSRIKVPTLITCGRHDEVTPEIAESLHSRIPNSILKIFEKSSHLQFWEERDGYMRNYLGFLRESDPIERG